MASLFSAFVFLCPKPCHRKLLRNGQTRDQRPVKQTALTFHVKGLMTMEINLSIEILAVCQRNMSCIKGIRHNIHEKSELINCYRVSKRDIPWTRRKSVRKNLSVRVPGHTWQKQTSSGPHTQTPDFVRDVNRKSVRQSLACINVNRREVVN